MIRKASGGNKREPIMQFAAGRWWVGVPPNGWPFIQRQQYGNTLYAWSFWLRLPFGYEFSLNGRRLKPRLRVAGFSRLEKECQT